MEKKDAAVEAGRLPVKAVLAWLALPEIIAQLGERARTGRTAVKRLAMDPEDMEPDEVEWLAQNARELARRAMAKGLGTKAARSYAARAVTVVRVFLEGREKRALPGLEDRRFREISPPPWRRVYFCPWGLLRWGARWEKISW